MEEGDTGFSDMQAGMVSPTLFFFQFLVHSSQIFKIRPEVSNEEFDSLFYLLCVILQVLQSQILSFLGKIK